MPEPIFTEGSGSPQAWLNRHAQRRDHGIPTLSVLSGPLGLCVHTWRQWAGSQQQPVVQLCGMDTETIITSWVAALARQRDLTTDALAFLSTRTGQPLAELRAGWQARTWHDAERFWERVGLDRHRDGTAAVCRWLTRRLVTGEPLDPDRLAGQFDGILQGLEGPWQRVLIALAGLLPPAALPGLLLVQPVACEDPTGWLDAAARVLTALVSQVARLPAALAIEPTTLERYYRTAPESHAQALLREGTVPISNLKGDAIAQRLDIGVVSGGLLAPIRRLSADGASEELVRAFGETVRSLQEPPGEEAEDRARSAAERFLFERLESLPPTAGRFALNDTLDFRFGNKDAEVDLLARGLRLAIEVDGYYHFRDPEGYRRDRRKDWELQRRGFVVLRFLAEDVVARMEEMLDTILSAVEHCQEHSQPERTIEP